MQDQITESIEDDILFWIVSFNSVTKIIELPASRSLAVFK